MRCRHPLRDSELVEYIAKYPTLEGWKTRDIAAEFHISYSSAYQKLLSLENDGAVVKKTGIERGHATHRWFAKEPTT